MRFKVLKIAAIIFSFSCLAGALLWKHNSNAVKVKENLDKQYDTNMAHGYFALKKNKADLAEKYFQKALQVNPRSARATNALGRLSITLRGDYKLAETYHQRAIAIDPRDPNALCDLGELKVRKGSYREAEMLFQRAMKVAPDWKWPIFNLAVLNEEVKHNYKEAKRMYISSISLDPL